MAAATTSSANISPHSLGLASIGRTLAIAFAHGVSNSYVLMVISFNVIMISAAIYLPPD